MKPSGSQVVFAINAKVSSRQLNWLFSESWPHHQERDFRALLRRNLLAVCAYDGSQLIGFVNVAWDGGAHAFLLDTTIHPEWRRRGIGRELVERATAAVRERGLQWLHVDYEPHLEPFYARCGFRSTAAGLIRL